MGRKLYEKVGRRYRPAAEEVAIRALRNGTYVVHITDVLTSIRRLPEADVGFAEGPLARLFDHVGRHVVRTFERRGSWSANDVAEAAVDAIRTFLRGEEVLLEEGGRT